MAIECLPPGTRRAMLDGIRSNPIIVGGYTDGRGGVCPMLAAHRAGGRTNFIGFAKAWDRFAQVGGRTRRATRRELLILSTHLEASLLDEDGPAPDLSEALAEHRQLVAQRARRGDPNREPELRNEPGWAWLRSFRRYDDYQRALARLQAERESSAAEREARTPELVG